MLAKALAVVAGDHEEGVLQEPAILQPCVELADEAVGVGDGVEVIVQGSVADIGRAREAERHAVVVVRGEGEHREEEGVVPLSIDPLERRREHDVVLVAEVARLVEARVREIVGAEEFLKAEALHHRRAVLEGGPGWLDKEGPVAALREALRETCPGEDAGLSLVHGLDHLGIEAAEDRDEGLRGVGDHRVRGVDEHAPLREGVQEGRGLQAGGVGRGRARAQRLKHDDDDVEVLVGRRVEDVLITPIVDRRRRALAGSLTGERGAEGEREREAEKEGTQGPCAGA